MNCVLCARRNPPRERDVPDGHVCPGCSTALRVDLGRILDLAAIAATMPDPFASRTTGTGPRPHPGSRPPIDVARIDPELILIRLEPGDPSSSVPLLVMLEDWERLIRDERGFAPYGPASELRAPTSAERGRTGVGGTRATLSGCVAFLVTQVDYVTTESTFGIEQFADNIRRAVATLRALDPTHERRDGWGIPCPTDVTTTTGCPGSDTCRCGCHDGHDQPCTMPGGCGLSTTERIDPCGRRLTIGRHDDGSLDLHGDITCRDCGTVWTAQRLLLVALADERVTVWGYPDAIAGALGITDRTLRRWAEAGHVEKLGNRYNAGQAFRHRHASERSAGA